MEKDPAHILVMNAGSSSIKFALFDGSDPVKKLADGSVNATSSVSSMMDKLREHVNPINLAAIGHRVVHGGSNYFAPAVVNEVMLAALRALEPFDQEHIPNEVRLIEECAAEFPGVPQVACFDTAFHHHLPRVARLLPIPRRYESRGVRRYGFHGISYSFLMKELLRVGGESAARARVVLAHLGSGASLAAVRDGKSVDTTMGFTPASGVPMSTRSGDLDPGLAWYLARTENMDAKQFDEMINNKSGLLGISETSADMLPLLDQAPSDERAEDAVALFCYEVKKRIGGFAAALGGLDTLVFTGGMGENAPRVRARVCGDLGFLGIELDEERNNTNADVISKDGGKVTVRVIRTDEAVMIAEETNRMIKKNG